MDLQPDWKEEILKKWAASSKAKAVVIKDEVRDRLAREFRGTAHYREPMKNHTSIRIGGQADVFLKPVDLEDLKAALKIATEEDLPMMLLGAGSNTLVRDAGIRGFVITSLSLQKQEIVSQNEETADIFCEAGVKISAFVQMAAEKGLSGCESLIGIPGTMGGAIFMNAGARGIEIKDIVREITFLDVQGTLHTVLRDKLEFSYRHLKLPRGAIILSGIFRLTKKDPQEVEETVRNYQKVRAETQPLNYPSLGSVFKNPESTKKGEVVSKAGELIEECGLKGVRVGGARVSEKHANFIVNEKQATAKDVVVLINLVRDKVKEKTGVLLETEVKILGEDT